MPEDIRLWSVGDGDELQEMTSTQLDLEEPLEKRLCDERDRYGSIHAKGAVADRERALIGEEWTG